MTKKDYELVASSVKRSLQDIKGWDDYTKAERQEVDYAINHVVTNIGMAMQSDNPRFDLERFLTACGL